MNGLFNYKNLPFESSTTSSTSRPPSNKPFSISTLDNTVFETGSVGGRVVYAVGNAALRGFQILAIRRKLRHINDSFPHTDNVSAKNIEVLYNNTLELSRRPGLYRPQIRKQAMRALLSQIATRQTRYLVPSLLQWPTVEICIFLSEVIACMPPKWLPLNTDRDRMRRELGDMYISLCPTTKWAAAPLVDFIVCLSLQNESACEAVISSGFLDMLVYAWAHNFQHIAATPQAFIKYHYESARQLGTDALVALCQTEWNKMKISSHPVCTFWPKDDRLHAKFGTRNEERLELWRCLGQELIDCRQRSIQRFIHYLRMDNTENSVSHELMGVCFDLAEFSREDIYGLLVAETAYSLLRELFRIPTGRNALSQLPVVDNKRLAHANSMLYANSVIFNSSFKPEDLLGMYYLQALKLKINGCKSSSIYKFFSLVEMPFLTTLTITNMQQVEDETRTIHQSRLRLRIYALPALRKLRIESSCIYNFFNLVQVPSLTTLTIVNIQQVEDVTRISNQSLCFCIYAFPVLRELRIDGCKSSSIYKFFSLVEMPSLTKLTIANIQPLEDVTRISNKSLSHLRIPQFPALLKLRIDGCKSSSVSEFFRLVEMPSLTTLTIANIQPVEDETRTSNQHIRHVPTLQVESLPWSCFRAFQLDCDALSISCGNIETLRCIYGLAEEPWYCARVVTLHLHLNITTFNRDEEHSALNAITKLLISRRNASSMKVNPRVLAIGTLEVRANFDIEPYRLWVSPLVDLFSWNGQNVKREKYVGERLGPNAARWLDQEDLFRMDPYESSGPK